MEKEKQEVSNRKICETRRAEATRREIAFMEKTGNMTVDVYAGMEPKTLGGKAIPMLTADNKYMLKQNAVETGCHNKEAGNCYVAKGAIEAVNSKMKLRDGEQMQPATQMFWDKDVKDGQKDKSYYVEVVNAAKLEKFVSHNKPISEETRDAVIKALEEKAFGKLDNEGTKDGKAWYDAAKDTAHVPKSDDKMQYMRDLVFAAASREVAKQTMRHAGIKFKREVSKAEQLMLKHFLASELRCKLQLGADERNGFNRESPSAKKDAINLLKRDEKMLFNVSRRAAGIAYALEQAHFKGLLADKSKDTEKDKAKATDKAVDKGNEI